MKKNTFIVLIMAFAMFGFGLLAQAKDGADDSSSGSGDDSFESGDNDDDAVGDDSEDISGESDDDSFDDSEEGDDSQGDDVTDDAGDDQDVDTSDDGRPHPAMMFWNNDRPTILDNIKTREEMRDGMMPEGAQEKMEEARSHMNETAVEARMRIRQNFAVIIGNFRDNFIPRIESRVAKMEAAGIDTKDVTNAIDDTKDLIDQIEEDYTAFTELVADETATKEAIQAAATDLKNSLMEIRKSLISVVEALKALVPEDGSTDDASSSND